MRKLDPIKILAEGSMREKIRLFYTDTAYLNTGKKDKVLFTPEQREQIYRELKTPRDKKYYEELRRSNMSFLLFKNQITNIKLEMKVLVSELHKFVGYGVTSKLYTIIINELLDVFPDKTSREMGIITALDNLNTGAKRVQKKNKPDYIQIQDEKIIKTIKQLAGNIQKKAIHSKNFIGYIRVFLNKYLPLNPYKDFLAEEELTVTIQYIEAKNQLEKFGYDFKLIPYDEIEIDIKEEGIEIIKRAGNDE